MASVEEETSLDDKYRAPALEKGLDIIELLSEYAHGLSQVEIAKALGRSPNEIYRMLTVLVRRGYIVKSQGERYELSMKLFVVAQRHPPLRRLIDQALPLMREATLQVQQSAHMGVYQRGEFIISAVVESPMNWGLAMRVGAVVGLYNTATGRILAAFSSQQRLEEMLEHHKPVPGEPLMERKAFEQILARIREQGYEEMPSGTTLGVTNLAFPIFSHGGEAIAALTCPYLSRIDELPCPSIEAVKTIFAEVARKLSFN